MRSIPIKLFLIFYPPFSAICCGKKFKKRAVSLDLVARQSSLVARGFCGSAIDGKKFKLGKHAL